MPFSCTHVYLLFIAINVSLIASATPTGGGGRACFATCTSIHVERFSKWLSHPLQQFSSVPLVGINHQVVRNIKQCYKGLDVLALCQFALTDKVHKHTGTFEVLT